MSEFKHFDEVKKSAVNLAIVRIFQECCPVYVADSSYRIDPYVLVAVNQLSTTVTKSDLKSDYLLSSLSLSIYC